MGITIHHTITRISKDQAQSCIELTKKMAEEVGFDFVEIEEPGYNYIERMRNQHGKITHRWSSFVADDWSHGWYPKIREGLKDNPEAYRTKRFGVLVHPPMTESFEMVFTPDQDKKYSTHAFCKTQPFSNDDPSVCAMVHVWVIAVLETIKHNITKKIDIDDEGDFAPKIITDGDRKWWAELKEKGSTDYLHYYENEFKPYQLETLMESFGENLALINAIGGQLVEAGWGDNIVQGMPITIPGPKAENIKSVGLLTPGDQYVYMLYEKCKVIMKTVSKTSRKITMPCPINPQ